MLTIERGARSDRHPTLQPIGDLEVLAGGRAARPSSTAAIAVPDAVR